MRILKTVSLFVVILVLLTSCFETDYTSSDDYIDGFSDGSRDSFMRMFNASDFNLHQLQTDVPWDTKHFTLTFSLVEDSGEQKLQYAFTLKDRTIEEAINDNSVFFESYGYLPGYDEAVCLLTDQFYYDFAAISGQVEKNKVIGTLDEASENSYIIIYIMIGGELYGAEYDV